jgi:hypothetical protein
MGDSDEDVAPGLCDAYKTHHPTGMM